MPGNSIGFLFRVTTFGESHGKSIGAVVDGCPPGIELEDRDFSEEMERRRPGGSGFDSPRNEKDRVEILSGVFQGLTTGAPLLFFIKNLDVKGEHYDVIQDLFRPGHGDYSYFHKYGNFDFRGGGRYSARETAARVAAGVVAKKILRPRGIRITAHTVELGGVMAGEEYAEADPAGPLSCKDPGASRRMEALLAHAGKRGDTLGGVVELRVTGCPAGLGEPVFDKLEADLAKAVMSIGAVKGFEVGAGFQAARMNGSRNNDPITPGGFRSNNAGGILGGISNGDAIVLRAAVKPVPSIRIPQDTIDRRGRPAVVKMEGRHDVCVIPRVIPVMEAMVAIVLADHDLRWRSQTSSEGLRD